MTSLDALLLGHPELRLVDAGTAIELDLSPQQTALLAYLGIARPRGTRSRDELVALFWPERSERRARAGLSQALYRLRGGLPDGLLRTRGDHEVVLDLEPAGCDVFRFEQAVAEQRFRDAVSEYRGELLSGFHLAGAGEFERWLAEERQYLAGELRRTVRQLAETLRDDDNPAAAARCLERALTLSPYEEEVASVLVQALARCGDVPGALLHHDAFVGRLRDELEIDPSPDFLALADVIRRAPPPVGPAVAGTRASPLADSRPPHPVGPAVAAPNVDDPPPSPHRSAPRGRRLRERVSGPALTSLVVVGVVAVGIVASTLRSGAPQPPLQPNRVLVATFANRTGDPALDAVGATAADWLTHGLASTGMVQVVLADAWVRSARGRDRRTPSSIDLARDLGAGLVLAGSVDRHGDSLFLQTRIMRVQDGTVIHALEIVRGSLDDPMPAVELLRQHSAGALASVLDPRLSSWTASATTPPSFKAYRSFVTALDLFSAGRYDEALDGFSRAAAAHQGFTAAVIWAAHTHLWAGREREADSVAATLEPLRDSLPPWDLAMLDYYRARAVNDWQGAYHAMRRVVQVAPRSEWSYLLAGAANQIGRPSEALRILIDVGPGLASAWYPYWSSRLATRHRMGDYEGELRDLMLARADRGPGGDRFEEAEIRALAGLGRWEDALAIMEEVYAATPEDLPGRTGVLRRARQEFFAHGRPDIAADLAEREFQVRLAQPESDRTSRQRVELARASYWTGRLEEARLRFESLPLEYDPGNIPGYLALIAAAQGRHDEARRISSRIAEAHSAPESEYWGVLWQARIAAALGEEERAMTLLEEAIARHRMGRFSLLTHDPDLAPLSALPRFQALLRVDQDEGHGV